MHARTHRRRRSSTLAASFAGRPAVSGVPRALSFAWSTASCAFGESGAPESLSSIVELKLPAISAPSTAIASKPATRETPLLIPEAIPTWCSGTELRAVAVSGATVAESPSPKTMMPGSTSVT